MALSGSFYNYPTSKFGLYCEWSGVQSVTGNYTNVTLNVYLQFYTISVGARSDSTISINGTSETYTAAAINDLSSTSWHKVLLKSKTVTVYHDSDGTKNNVALSASWRFSGTYGGVSVGTITASTTVNLDKIDRTAPTVSFSVSSITSNGFTLSASSSATSDIWQYSTDNGSSWTQFSTTAGTSASKTVTGLSPNTSYTVKVRARKKSNQVYGTSGGTTVKTLGGAVVNSVSTVTADASTVSIVLNVTVYEASYTNTLVIKNGSSSYLTISGLSWAKGTANRTVTLTTAQRTTLLTAMASVKSFTGTFAVSSYSGSTQIGTTSSKTATVQTTSASSAPTNGGFTFEDSNTTTVNITGDNQLFIQSQSTLKVTPVAATPKNNATIANYTVTCNGLTASSTTASAMTVGKITASGSVSVVLTVTDSRGYTSSVTQTVTVIPYTKPRMSSVSVRRTNDIEAEMQLVFNGTISAINVGGTQTNSVQYARYRYKLTSETSYSAYYSILGSVTRTGTSFSFSNLELCNLDSANSYNFHLQIRDRLGVNGSIDLYFVIPQGTPLLALRRRMVGINTPTPEAELHVVGNAKVSGTLTATSLSGTLPTSKLSGILPVNKGGTGASTIAGAIAMLINSEVISPSQISVEGNQYHVGGTYGIQMNNSDIVGTNAIYFQDDCNTAGEGINFYRSSTTWDRLYASAGVLYFSPNIATDTHPGTRYTVYHSGGATIPVSKGGTGSTTASGARTNLGITCTELYTGTLTTGSTTFNYGSYKAYIIVGSPTSTSSRCTMIIPKSVITTSVVTYQFADESHFYAFKLSYSGSTVTLAFNSRSSSGQIYKVYGVN